MKLKIKNKMVHKSTDMSVMYSITETDECTAQAEVEYYT